MDYIRDVGCLKKFVEKDYANQFLLGLNPTYDKVP